MPDYRAFLISPDGQFFRRIDLDCEDDDTALQPTKQLADGHDIELWQLDRGIGTFPKRQC